MAAPTGNEFWKLRSKHGRKRLFASPKLMWVAACEYFQWCVDNPLIEIEQAKSPAKPYKDEESGEWVVSPPLIELPKMRAFTIIGLCHYLDCNQQYMRDFKESLTESDIDKDFSLVITRIEETIYNQKFTGAASGFLNPNIIARDLGLKEKSESEIKGGFSFNLNMSQPDDKNDPIE